MGGRIGGQNIKVYILHRKNHIITMKINSYCHGNSL